MLRAGPGPQQGPAQGWGCSISPLVSAGPGPHAGAGPARLAMGTLPRALPGDAEERDSVKPSGRRGGVLHARVCGHRGVRGDSGTAGRHGPSLPFLSGQLSPGRGPTEPQAFICRGLRLDTQAHSPDTAGVCGLQSVSPPTRVRPPPPRGPGAAEEDGPQRKRRVGRCGPPSHTQDTQDRGRPSQAEAACPCLDEGMLDSWEQDPHPKQLLASKPTLGPSHRKAQLE